MTELAPLRNWIARLGGLLAVLAGAGCEPCDKDCTREFFLGEPYQESGIKLINLEQSFNDCQDPSPTLPEGETTVRGRLSGELEAVTAEGRSYILRTMYVEESAPGDATGEMCGDANIYRSAIEVAWSDAEVGDEICVVETLNHFVICAD